MEIHIPIKIGVLSPMVAHVLLSSAIAFVLPWITAFVNNRKMTDRQRVVMAGGIAALFALVQTIVTGGFTFADWATAFMVMWPLQQTFYRNIAIPWGIRKFENETSETHQRDDTVKAVVETAETVVSAAPAAEAVLDAIQSGKITKQDIKELMDRL